MNFETIEQSIYLCIPTELFIPRTGAGYHQQASLKNNRASRTTPRKRNSSFWGVAFIHERNERMPAREGFACIYAFAFSRFPLHISWLGAQQHVDNPTKVFMGIFEHMVRKSSFVDSSFGNVNSSENFRSSWEKSLWTLC